MTTLVTLPVIIPIAGAALSLMAIRHPQLRRVVGLSASLAYFIVALRLVFGVGSGGTAVASQGSWPPPLGIPLVADRLAVMLLAAAATALLAVLIYAVARPRGDTEFAGFHATYQMLSAGVALSLLTGDLFTLFVAFEIMLTASYVLLTYRTGRDGTRSTITYVVIGLVASALLLTAIALTYAVSGTVNIADLTVKLDRVPDGLRSALGWLFFLVFGIKAAIFPLFFWLPDSYPIAPTPVTALFAGLLTKIGVYAIVRTQTLLFPSDGPSTGILIIAGLTMVVGALGAIAQTDIKRILSFHIVSQIGYMIMGLGFFTVGGVTAAIVFIVHQIIVKASLFLAGGLVEHTEGTGAIDEVGGVATRSPAIAVIFGVSALSLAGFPPFSGFVGKLALVESGLDAGRWIVVGVSLAASILTLFSMTKIWSGVFWGKPTGIGRSRVPRGMLAGTAGLVVAGLVVAAAAQPILEYAERAATELLTEGAYAEAVLGATR